MMGLIEQIACEAHVERFCKIPFPYFLPGYGDTNALWRMPLNLTVQELLVAEIVIPFIPNFTGGSTYQKLGDNSQ